LQGTSFQLETVGLLRFRTSMATVHKDDSLNGRPWGYFPLVAAHWRTYSQDEYGLLGLTNW